MISLATRALPNYTFLNFINMSYYANNEYIIASNNSMNENKYNSEKLKKSGLKALLRPLMKIIKKTTKKSAPAKTCNSCSYEDEQNSSNESLERQIIEEMEQCPPGSAFFVYNNESCDIVPVNKNNLYVPVNFARTDAGTFFWTSVSKADIDFAFAHCYTECQTAEQQYPIFQDRWVQA